MIKYIKNEDLKNEYFLKDADEFFSVSEKIGFPKTPNSIHLQRQIQYPYCFHSLKLKGNERIFDAGCGFTVWPIFLKEKYPDTEIHVYDLSKPHLDRFSDKFIKKVGDLTKITYPNNYFDVIYCISTLEHITEWEKTIKEFGRIIKTDGYLCLVVDGMADEKYFKNKGIEKLCELLRENFKITLTDLDKKDAWLYSGVEGNAYSLVFILQSK